MKFMKRLILGLCLIGTMALTSCVNDDDASFVGAGTEQLQKSDEPQELGLFTIDGTGKVDIILLDGEPATEVATILCHDNYTNGFGKAVVKHSGGYNVVYWHTDPSKLPSGFTVTQYTSAFGGTRYMVSCPVSESSISLLCP